VRRGNDVGELQERPIHPEFTVPDRFDPPCINARCELPLGLQMLIERDFVDNFPAR
jgi:hypothetical protein